MKRAIHLVVLLLAFACKNEENSTPDPEPNPPTEAPLPTEVGIPVGPPTTATIGGSGGTIIAEDGLLAVHVPAGAVASNTEFSIQPLAGFCPGGINPYRLLPAGLRFSQPVELVFHLPGEVNPSTSPEVYGIAFQDAEGIWYTMPEPVVDIAAKTVSTEVMHFTDWTAIEFIKISPPHDPIEIKVNQTTNLLVIGQGVAQEDPLPPLPTKPKPIETDPNDDELPPLPQDDELPPLPAPKPFKVKWFVNNIENGNDEVGRIGNIEELLYSYKAPSEVPSNNTVVVRAELTNFKQWKTINKKKVVKNHVKLILLKQIHIRPEEFKYKLNLSIRQERACGYDGQVQHDAAEMDVLVTDGQVSVSNIVNHKPTVVASAIDLAGCLITCEPGNVGELNVTSAVGEASDHGSKFSELRITLQHSQLNSGKVMTLVCAGGKPTSIPSQMSDRIETLPFALADSAQTISGTVGSSGTFLARLIPQN